LPDGAAGVAARRESSSAKRPIPNRSSSGVHCSSGFAIHVEGTRRTGWTPTG